MFIRCIALRYPKASFTICTSSQYASPFEKLPNIKNLGSARRTIDRIYNKIAGKQIFKRHLEMTANATMHIGGSIFIEPDHFTMPKEYHSNPNLFVIGCNFGPYHTEMYRHFVFAKLQKAKDVCFRDRYSYDVFSEIEHVRVAPDVLFGYREYPAVQEGCGVGISVINLDKRSDVKHMADTYYDVLAKIVDDCSQKKIPVKLFSFCTDEGDLQAIEEVMNRSETKNAQVCAYEGDIAAILAQINACEYIIASRFHAMIIGWCLSKKVFPVVYSDKQVHVMEDMAYQESYWDLRKETGFTAIELLEHLHTIHSVDTRKYQLLSCHQFDGLDEYFKNTV